MSYDIYLTDPKTGDTLELSEKHHLTGGTYAVGGTKECHLNVTYNYSRHYYRFIDEELGIRRIYGMTGEQSIPILVGAITAMGEDTSENYWEPTEGNARQALIDLATLATHKPYGIWKGD